MGRTSVLTHTDISLIRAAAGERKRLLQEAAKLDHKALADKFGVSQTTISAIVNYYYSYINSEDE